MDRPFSGGWERGRDRARDSTNQSVQAVTKGGRHGIASSDSTPLPCAKNASFGLPVP